MTRAEYANYSSEIKLTERRLLSIDQFRAYAGDLKYKAAMDFLEQNSTLVRRIGRTVLIDRAAFDLWCDRNYPNSDIGSIPNILDNGATLRRLPRTRR